MSENCELCRYRKAEYQLDLPYFETNDPIDPSDRKVTVRVKKFKVCPTCLQRATNIRQGKLGAKPRFYFQTIHDYLCRTGKFVWFNPFNLKMKIREKYKFL